MFKKVYSLYSAFYPSLRFTLCLQSAVCSPQSAFYTDRFFYVHFRPQANLQSATKLLRHCTQIG